MKPRTKTLMNIATAIFLTISTSLFFYSCKSKTSDQTNNAFDNSDTASGNSFAVMEMRRSAFDSLRNDTLHPGFSEFNFDFARQQNGGYQLNSFAAQNSGPQKTYFSNNFLSVRSDSVVKISVPYNLGTLKLSKDSINAFITQIGGIATFQSYEYLSFQTFLDASSKYVSLSITPFNKTGTTYIYSASRVKTCNPCPPCTCSP